MKLLVLEGPDGAGKSTLAEELHRRTGWPIMHTGGRKSHEAMRDWCKDVMDTMDHQQNPVICDRHHAISEPIYSQVLGRVYLHIEMPVGMVVIYCRPTSYIHSPREGEDPSHIQELSERTAALVHMYDQFLKGCVRWNWQHDHNLDLLEAYVRSACLER